MSGLSESQYKKLKTNIDFLAKYPELRLEKISENKEINNAYSVVLNSLVDSRENSHIRKQFKKIVGKIHHPTEITPDTIGSFIFGCQRVDYGDVEKYCSYLCVNSWNTANQSKCEKNIFAQISTGNEDRFIFKNIIDSDKCYIYIHDDFQGFYSHELDKLHSHKIKYVQLLTTKNSKHFKHMKGNDFIPLHTVPRINPVKQEIEIKDGSKDDPWMIFIFLSILIIIIVFVLIFRRHFL